MLASYFHLLDKKSDAFPGYLYTHIFKKQLEEDLFPTSLPMRSTENSPNFCHNEARHSDLLVVCLGFFKMTDSLQCNILAVVFDGGWLVGLFLVSLFFHIWYFKSAFSNEDTFYPKPNLTKLYRLH